MKTNVTLTQPKQAKDLCRFCGRFVNLDDEGVTYPNGKCAHDSCNDGNEFNKANESDSRD